MTYIQQTDSTKQLSYCKKSSDVLFWSKFEENKIYTYLKQLKSITDIDECNSSYSNALNLDKSVQAAVMCAFIFCKAQFGFAWFEYPYAAIMLNISRATLQNGSIGRRYCTR